MPRSKPAPIRPPAADVLRFAEHVERAVRKDRLKKRRAGEMDNERVARDIALAAELHRWAKAHVMEDAPLG